MNLILTIILYGLLLAGLIFWAPWGHDFENFKSYHSYYLLVALAIWIFSYKYFGGRFVRPKWKQGGKFIAYMVTTFILLVLLGHYALIFIIGHQALGGVGHFMICKKHNIDFWTSQPEDKYLEVTEKWAKGDFGKAKE